MPPSSPLICDVSKVPPPRNRFGKNPLALCRPRKWHAKSPQIVVKINANLTSFRVGFHGKSCAWGVFVRVSFFVNLLTFSGSLDPQSARAGAVETQFLNLRFLHIKCTLGTIFLHIFWHFDIIFFARSTCKNNGEKKHELSSNLGPQKGPRKVVFWSFFGAWFRRCARVVPSVLSGASGLSQRWLPVSPGALKVSPYIKNGVP